MKHAALLLRLGLVTACCAGQLFAAAPVALRFDLAAGPAEQALRSFSLQSGRELLFSTAAASVCIEIKTGK